ncbi:hypothetical protein DFR50_11497 [Roseiarcus fermentans]|uniref:Uncharacterized protein n=1 Tax=Roseiarcus fermentans TaxID=1473586 RepID=A0A366FCG2_9HYPH|nr:hypothetical protein DFR50_11497 [Roseiarcus fermentans]
MAEEAKTETARPRPDPASRSSLERESLGAGAAGGATVGSVVGLVFGSPIIGALVGAGVGAGLGHLANARMGR